MFKAIANPHYRHPEDYNSARLPWLVIRKNHASDKTGRVITAHEYEKDAQDYAGDLNTRANTAPAAASPTFNRDLWTKTYRLVRCVARHSADIVTAYRTAWEQGVREQHQTIAFRVLVSRTWNNAKMQYTRQRRADQLDKMLCLRTDQPAAAYGIFRKLPVAAGQP